MSTAERKKLTVRVSEAEYDELREAAFRRRTTLSAWVRKVLLATARGTNERRDLE